MSAQALTDWFPPEVKPARPGWYQREYIIGDKVASWSENPDWYDGSRWYYGYGSGEYSSRPETCPNPWRWRGLAEPPLTDWFGGGATPVHVGVYEIDWNVGRGRAFSHWGGSRWGFASWEDFSGGIKEAIEDALCPSSRFSKVEKFRWRGLAYEVKA